ncbi:MAG: RHS repeat-associated core domain-containing protein [Candidatus Accumulibacter necessarius]|jgi:RHS repeat-associated protein
MQSLRQDLRHRATCRLLALIELVPTTTTLRLKTAASCSFRWARLAQVLAAAGLLLAAFSAWAAPSIGGVQVTPNAIAAGVPTTVRVTATITDPTAIPASVNLQRVSDAGAVVAVVDPLRDDGLNGDAIAGDQVYTLDAVFTETTPVRLRVSAGFKGMLKRLFSASVLLNINCPPLANAGPDQRVARGKLVVLDGSASLDPEGVPLIYTWSLIGRPVGSSAVLAAANSAGATFTADRPGDYFVQPIVSDGQLASALDAVSITVIHTPPTVSLTAPDEGSVHTLPVTVTLAATASDTDGTIAKVEFVHGATLIGSATAAPYTVAWNNVPAGSYSLTAKTTDNLGGTRTSEVVPITVTAAGPTILYLHGDHLGTPRAATNEANMVIWRNLPTTEPFGIALPEEDPDGDGQVTKINLRFPGQYLDRETQLHYNYFRDYDPGIGRYVQSDPIGLPGGVNTYGYVGGNPLNDVDPLGLAAQCNCHKIIEVVRSKLQSRNWASKTDRSSDAGVGFGRGRNKCNLFICDVLTEALGQCPRRTLSLSQGPISAGDWANRSKNIPGFDSVQIPQPGDIAAVAFPNADASGHVAIVDGPGWTISPGEEKVSQSQ